MIQLLFWVNSQASFYFQAQAVKFLPIQYSSNGKLRWIIFWRAKNHWADNHYFATKDPEAFAPKAFAECYVSCLEITQKDYDHGANQ